MQNSQKNQHSFASVSDQIEQQDSQSLHRAGIVTFWALVALPVFLIMLCIVVEIGNLWMARIQLKNALEAAALAGVKTWGDAGGGDTSEARAVANQHAMANVINGVSVDLSALPGGLNDNLADVDNDNATCTGTLIFGTITSDDPEYTFDSCETGGCASVNGTVLIDASSNGNLNAANDWGVSFQPNGAIQAGLFITRVVIRLPGADGDTTLPYFDFSSGSPQVSGNTLDNDGSGLAINNKVRCDSTDLNCGAGANQGRSQADIFGLTSGDISFGTLSVANFGDAGAGARLECSASPSAITITNQTSKVLVIDFAAGTFAQTERFRFGANINPGGISPFDGDVIGGDALPSPAEVTVCFNMGDPITGQFVDTNDRLLGQEGNCSNVTFASWGSCDPDFLGGATGNPGRRGMIINGADGTPTQRLRADQPPPPSNENGNNGQSLVSFSASGTTGHGFAVRATATANVTPICESFFGVKIGSYSVTARVDALYECVERVPRLYHVDEGLPDFICTTSCP